jgi:hypothetical protein
MLCALKEIDTDVYRHLFIERRGRRRPSSAGARMRAGFENFGEDQIISQVRDAIVLARKKCCTDMVLEKVFQTAIGADKKVKTQVQLADVDGSTALQVIFSAEGRARGSQRRCLLYDWKRGRWAAHLQHVLTQAHR